MKNFSTVVGQVHRTVRLLIAMSLGFFIFFLTHQKHSINVSFLLGWIAFALCLLAFSWITIFSNDYNEIGIVASDEDSSKLFIFSFVVVAAFISLFAIILLLQNFPVNGKQGSVYRIPLSLLAVTCSWFLIHTIFTLRYAHLYYWYATPEEKNKKQHRGGLLFPGDKFPDLLDFGYFSFVVGTTFQVSDVQVTSKIIRRHVLVHGLLSFLYNSIIVSLAINILSGILGR